MRTRRGRGLGPAGLLGNRLAGRRWKRHHSCRLAHHLLHLRGSHGNYRVYCPYGLRPYRSLFSISSFIFFWLLLCFLLRGLCCCFGSFLPGSFIWIMGNFGAKVTDELQYCHEYRFWSIEKIIGN